MNSEQADASHLYTIPAGVPFALALAQGVLARYGKGDDPLALSRIRILVPTRRAVRSVTEAFMASAKQSGRDALLLPMIQPIGDVDDEALIFDPGGSKGLTDGAAQGIPQSVSPLQRQFQLMRLVMQWSKTAKARGLDIGATGPAQAALLAAELGRLIDLLETEGVQASALQGLVSDPYAEHWGQTLDFLKIVTEHWPKILAAQGCIGQAERQGRMLRGLAEQWRVALPKDPVIAAGSTGSIPATAELLAVIAHLPQGAVVLPGLDLDLDETAWAAVDQAHPQFGMKDLLARFGAERSAVRLWEDGQEPASSGASPAFVARRHVINEALRPAQVTDDWRLAVEKFESEQWGEGLKGLSYIEAANESEEALAVALVLREVVEQPGARAALVTPDRNLSRRVAAHLARWDIAINDSAGTPLGQTPAGIFLRLVAEVVALDVAPTALMSLLMHPLCAVGVPKARCRILAREFELLCLRGPRPASGLGGLRARFEAACRDEHNAPGKAKRERLSAFLDRLETCLAPFMELGEHASLSFSDILKAHIRCAEALACEQDIEVAPALWGGDDGEAASRFMASLLEEAPHLGELRSGDYFALLETLMAGQVVRPRWGLHPRLSILGPLEARLQHADVIVLGGLNEGTWPAEARVDPWLNRPMRTQLGLPSPERRIGLSAHDFAQLACGPRVVLTRPAKVGGVASVASRWILRLLTLLRGAGAQEALVPEYPYLAWARAMQEAPPYQPTGRPAPRPPLAARPRKFSVTEIETWIRDPYAIYAKKILNLKPLADLDEAPDQRDQGIVIHEILDEFIGQYKDDLPEKSYDRLIEIGAEKFSSLDDRPSIRAIWWPRFERIARWFVDTEPTRRARAMPLAVEVKGKMSFASPGGEFVLTGRADRIDQGPGGLIVYDYKTGSPPSSKEVEMQFAPQMPLEALMAAQGLFDGVPAGTIEGMCYIALKGGETVGEEIFVPKGADVLDVIEATQEGLLKLISDYDDEAIAYLSRPRVQFLSRGSDYDHLARVDEWSAAGSDGEAGSS